MKVDARNTALVTDDSRIGISFPIDHMITDGWL
jgi:hypothetical protein